MKTEFKLVHSDDSLARFNLSIVGESPNHKPYVKISGEGMSCLFIRDKDLERLAVNILKSLKSKYIIIPSPTK